MSVSSLMSKGECRSSFIFVDVPWRWAGRIQMLVRLHRVKGLHGRICCKRSIEVVAGFVSGRIGYACEFIIDALRLGVHD
jgi:hypothetical protein